MVYQIKLRLVAIIYIIRQCIIHAQQKTPTEFPRASNAGDQIPIPITFGTTKTNAPDTPLFAGRPTLKAN